jgi:oxygen-dependent protoporphyrinogen oxidase
VSVKRLVVVGAGISGLAAAWTAAREGAQRGLEVVVLERGDAPGGKARTVRQGDWTIETGPTGYLAPDPAVDRLAEQCGLADEKVPADEAAAHRFVVRGGRMREVSAHPVGFVRSGILGPLGVARIAAEPWIRRREESGEESVWGFARRRLGPQAADRLVAPMVLGVFAGDAKKLSLGAAFPRLAELEAEHGSLIRGMIARKRQGAGGGGPAGPAGHLTSFRDGLESLPRALAKGPFEVRCGVAVENVVPGAEAGYEVLAGGERLHADAVVLASEAWAAASMVQGMAPELAARLNGIAYPPVAVVALGFDLAAAGSVPRGFGVLVPRGEGYRCLGFLWDSYIFPGRSASGKLLLRAMVGGAVDPEALTLGDEGLVELVCREAQRLLGVEGRPEMSFVKQWPRAIPQYELGHLERAAGIEAERERYPGLFLAGNALQGIAFGKATAAGVAAGEQAAQYLASLNDRGNVAREAAGGAS